MNLIDIYDYLLLPLYLMIFYFIIVIKAKKYGDSPLRKYFIIGFFLHMGGSILYCMVIYYYYTYGDSILFYQGGTFLRNVISSTGDPISPFFMSSGELLKTYGTLGTDDNILPVSIGIDSNLAVMKISAIVSYLCFNSYLIISLFFGLFAFTGLWKLYKTFNEIMERKSERWLAYTVLFLPSVCFWGSGLIKDSICLGCLGFVVYYVYRIFIKKKFRYLDFLFLAIFLYLLFVIKSYLLVAFIVAACLGYVVHLVRESKTSVLKLTIRLLILASVVVIGLITFSSVLSAAIEDFMGNIETFKYAYSNLDEDLNGSGFVFSATDYSISGLLLGSPIAIFTTLFRPFLWESGKPVIFLSALESALILAATLYLLIKCRVTRFFYYTFTNPYAFFCFTFCMMLALIVGYSTFNFGTMVRYRLPILPFYFFLLLFIYTKNKEDRNATDHIQT